MTTYLEQLPYEIYEIIYKNLEDYDSEIQLLKIRPVEPKLCLQLFQIHFDHKWPCLYVNLKESKNHQKFLEGMISCLLEPETLNRFIHGNDDPYSVGLDENYFLKNVDTFLDEECDKVPYNNMFLRQFLYIFYQNDLFIKCINGDFGAKNKETLESYIKNYARNKDRIKHFSKTVLAWKQFKEVDMTPNIIVDVRRLKSYLRDCVFLYSFVTVKDIIQDLKRCIDCFILRTMFNERHTILLTTRDGGLLCDGRLTSGAA